jgi:hypothetical protein
MTACIDTDVQVLGAFANDVIARGN